jgi:DNA-binding response OmpR family regulator
MTDTKVLVLDDDSSVSEMIGTGLETFGYKVALAGNEKEFWASVTREKPDIILMDVGMPGIDGISLCRHVRLSESAKDIPIIIVTAFNDEKTFHDAMLFGANDFIAKPFDIGEIKRKIDDIITKTSLRKSS